MAVRVLVLSIALSGIWAGSALAEDRGSQADQDACTPDVFKLCSDFIPNEDPIVACLKSKRDQLSPACRHVFFSDPPPVQDQTTSDGSNDAASPAQPEAHKQSQDEADDTVSPPSHHHKAHHSPRGKTDDVMPPRHHKMYRWPSDTDDAGSSSSGHHKGVSHIHHKVHHPHHQSE